MLRVPSIAIRSLIPGDTSERVTIERQAFSRGLADLVGEITLNDWTVTGFSVFCIDERDGAFELWSPRLRFLCHYECACHNGNVNWCNVNRTAKLTLYALYRVGEKFIVEVSEEFSRYHAVGSSDNERTNLCTAFIIPTVLDCDRCTRATVDRRDFANWQACFSDRESVRKIHDCYSWKSEEKY